MTSCRITYIYGLFELGKENQIRYIGKSDNPKKRLKDHRNEKYRSPKCDWVRSVLCRNGQIGMKILATVPYEVWEIKEIELIKEWRKISKLCNLTDGGDGKMSNIFYKSLGECKEWIKLNKPDCVVGMKEYKKWSKMPEFPKFLPKAPNKVFSDWVNWGDFLGKLNMNDIYLGYEEAKQYLKENFNLKSSYTFKKTNLPIFIPKTPQKAYKEWKGWEDFLGYKSKFRKNKNYLDFESARIWIKDNYGKITTEEYRKMSKNNTLSDLLPKKPEKFYKDFKWSEYLFTNGKKRDKSFYMKFEESREIVRKLNIKTNLEWRRWCKNKSDDFIRIPSSPEQVYDKWVDWFDWLGTKKI
jgi:hypothetical protein